MQTQFPRALLQACPSSALILFLFAAIGPGFSSDIAADGPQLSILPANVTSMRKNFEIIRGFDSSYNFLQETTLNVHGQSSMRKVLHRTGYDALFGPPCGLKLSGSQFQRTVWNSKSGGFATVARHIVSTLTSGKCTLTWIPTDIGARGFHVFNIYGYVGAGPKNPKALTLNEDFLAAVISEIISLGDGPGCRFRCPL